MELANRILIVPITRSSAPTGIPEPAYAAYCPRRPKATSP
ncbi:hypothetical protein EPK99_23560 [Neorhizobium lilium]|uniref:Uncharacterized protein n=1 Tax=Neorhizobium lilium TaxID=2503024 RepID=A0A444LBA9_9HYPH|nr:hypothetical protein EPK99_23560 [Neorhizobium lilium]